MNFTHTHTHTHTHMHILHTPKGEMKEKFKTTHLPLTLAKLEKSAAENNCEEGWIYGSKVELHDEQF